MSVEESEAKMSAVERLISDCSTKVWDRDGPSLAALLKAIGPEAAKKAQEAPLFGWDSPTKAFLKKHRAWIYAAIVTAAQWAFPLSFGPAIPKFATFVVVYGVVEVFLVFRGLAETVDEMNGRLNVLRHVVAVHTLRDENWKWKSGIEIKDQPRLTGLDVARRLVDWDGETSDMTKENEARWKIMSDVLNPERGE